MRGRGVRKRVFRVTRSVVVVGRVLAHGVV
jgi:hypothetical protein